MSTRTSNLANQHRSCTWITIVIRDTTDLAIFATLSLIWQPWTWTLGIATSCNNLKSRVLHLFCLPKCLEVVRRCSPATKAKPW